MNGYILLLLVLLCCSKVGKYGNLFNCYKLMQGSGENVPERRTDNDVRRSERRNIVPNHFVPKI